MQLNKFLDVKPEVAEAIAAGKPVVALESTIISHGMPYPQNVQTALEVERIIRVGSHVRDFERWTEFGKRCYTLKIMGTRKLVRIRLVPADGQRFENYVMSHWM